jgi:hypothetical protein
MAGPKEGWRMFRVQLSRFGWRGYAGLAFAVAAALAVLVLSLGLALVLLPLVAVVLLIGRWRLARMQAASAGGTPEPGRIIEVEYSVIEDGHKR